MLLNLELEIIFTIAHFIRVSKFHAGLHLLIYALKLNQKLVVSNDDKRKV